MIQASDTNIRAYVRSVLTHRRIELSCLDIGSYRGTVRLRGEMRRIGGSADITAELLETLENEIRQQRGVRRVHLHFSNWKKREATGEWVTVAQAGNRTILTDEGAEEESRAVTA